MDINTAAPVITRDEILLHAPIETIWEIQTDVAGWPSWQPEADGAQIDGPLAVGSAFAGTQPAWTSPRPSRRSTLLAASSGAACAGHRRSACVDARTSQVQRRRTKCRPPPPEFAPTRSHAAVCFSASRSATSSRESARAGWRARTALRTSRTLEKREPRDQRRPPRELGAQIWARSAGTERHEDRDAFPANAS